MTRRLVAAFLILVALVHLGAWGFYEILNGEASYFECLYRTVILITTVNEPVALGELVLDDRRRLFDQYTMIILLLGMGLVLYVVSTFAAWVIESDLRRGVRRRKIRRMIDALRGHIVVCGGGETGQLMRDELESLGQEFVIIESDPERVEELELDAKAMVLHGDATQDRTLEDAGIRHASGVIAALPGDMENLFVVITARQIRPDVHIVSRAIDPLTERKLRQAGANQVVAANTIAAKRMVWSSVRPEALNFVDQLLWRGDEAGYQIEEAEVEPGSAVAGQTLGESGFGAESGLLVLAIRPESEDYRCNPSAETRIEPKSRLVVFGATEKIPRLKEWTRG
ncbi:MAG: potassium channel protein [Planctomycetota bacterium]